uniref:Uncharacterized protein n=1 Tax=Cannabis sativa TaxID=3483 RepID=A0A803P351_CANSA
MYPNTLYFFTLFLLLLTTGTALAYHSGPGGTNRKMSSDPSGGGNGNPTGATGSAHGPNWDYSWGWGSSPGAGWGYGSGSGRSPNGFGGGSPGTMNHSPVGSRDGNNHG